MRVLLVDGYNVIHNHPRLSGLTGGDMEAAREDLLAKLSPLSSPSYYHVVAVVFDAAGSRHAEPVVEERGGLRVVFTRRGQTADSFIEAAVRRMAPEFEVDVATSDRMLSDMASGFGAGRIDGVTILRRAEEALAETREEIGRVSRGKAPPLQERISAEARRMLEKLRFQD